MAKFKPTPARFCYTCVDARAIGLSVFMDTKMPNETLYTVDQVAAQLSVHPETVRNWIKQGQLVAIHLGGAAGYRISESDLSDFLRRRRGITKELRH